MQPQIPHTVTKYSIFFHLIKGKIRILFADSPDIPPFPRFPQTGYAPLRFLFHSDNYKLYIVTQVGIGIIVAIYLFIKLENKLHFVRMGHIRKSEYKENISSGIILMLGNFSSGIFTGLDRWFVKLLLSAINFAMYSFAVSVESIINVFISPITISMYNYFQFLYLLQQALLKSLFFPSNSLSDKSFKCFFQNSLCIFFFYIFYILNCTKCLSIAIAECNKCLNCLIPCTEIN